MITLKIELYDGTNLETTVDTFDSEALATKLNSTELNVVAIGNVVVNRNIVRAVYEVTTP